MRHLKKTKKLKRTTEERRKLFVDLSRGLIRSGKITTFTTRAKWFAPQFERLITNIKKSGDNQVLALRKMRKYFSEEDSKKIVTEIAPLMLTRNGGYTRIFKVSDNFSTLDKSIVTLTVDN
jgi:large subunit ribosomal protein L17